MKFVQTVTAVLAFAFLAAFAANDADASYRQYYSGWRYYPQRTYYYTTYYYKPAPTYTTYSYHYCVYYPSQPRYVYYYNPYSRQYWGRFDLEGKPGEQYSLLKEEDRKERLEDIPETAFPKPAAMPAVPESQDGAAIEPPPGVPEQDLPGSTK